jgi:PadR family transcriptional regulator PadR
MRRELLRSHLDLMVLAVLDRGPAHGYRLIRDLERRSGGTFNLPEGTVYPILHRLENEGLVASRWAIDQGRRRRVYALSAAGRAALKRSRAEWRQLVGAVDTILRGA